MSQLKIILALLVGFGIPVTFGVLIGPLLFSGSDNNSYSSIEQAPEVQPVEHSTGFKARMLEMRQGDSFGVVAHDPLLDPLPEKIFLAAFVVRFDELPRVGKRESLVLKYAAEKPPHAGWGISLRRRDTSLRPELYYVGANGQGSWYSFDALDLKPGAWYSFAALIKPGQFINLFVEEFVEGEVPVPVFFGGYDISAIPAPSSTSDLSFGALQSGGDSFTGSLGLLLIAQLDELPKKRAQLIELLSGTPADVAQRIPSETITLWLGPDGMDQSRFRRSVSLTGSAVWKKM